MYLKEKELNSYFQSIILEQKFLLQPFIECKTKNGLTYDFDYMFKKWRRKVGNNLIYHESVETQK